MHTYVHTYMHAYIHKHICIHECTDACCGVYCSVRQLYYDNLLLGSSLVGISLYYLCLYICRVHTKY